ncbi:HAD family hydrolase [Candidatus Bathyarchaeota archaeon]|nr:MAG: HAD family hydrolase [Candidatus Bathyarchaeota archaeon]
MRVKAVLFDLGGTLIKTAEVPEIYKRILKRFGVNVTSDEILKAHRANEEEFDIAKGQLEFGQDFWIKWNLRVLERIGITENIEYLAQKVDELWWDHADLEVYSDVFPMLAQLRTNGVKLGLVTNGLKRDFEYLLKRMELADCFDVVVGMDTCDKAKPDKEIFLFALNKLGIHPEQALFVGDSVKNDYKGAEGAGMKPLIIDREGKAPSNVDKIESLTALLSLLDET